MKKYQTFDEMFNDDEMVSPEDREQINLEVALIGKMVEAIENRLQHIVLDIKNKYGKNAIVKAMNLEEGATTIERNQQIGGHKG